MTDNIDFSNKLFKDAYDSIDNFQGKNLLITGGAGSGKSLILETMFQRLKDKKKNVVVITPTGVSSALLSEKGITSSTIHSFFKLEPLGFFEKKIDLSANKKKMIKKLSYLIIDEVSMVSPALFDHILWMLNELGFKGNLILFGDFYQMSPVVNLENNSVLDYYISNGYINNKWDVPQFFDSHSYKSLEVITFTLEKTYRQSENDFIQALSRIRTAEQTVDDLNLINSRVVEPYIFQEEHKNLLYLSSTNRTVDIINKNYESSFEGKPYMEYKIKADGTYSNRDGEKVRIYEGQQVMCIHNNREQGYQNGTLGTVLDLSNDSILIDVNSTEKLVSYNTWTDYKLNYDSKTNEIEKIECGTLSSIGCKVAYATTIHKAQGLTLDALYLDLSSQYVPTSGIYLALSRARTLNGIGISRKILPRDIKINKRIAHFYSTINNKIFE